MGSLEIKVKHPKSDKFKEHYEEVLELIKERRLSHKFDPSYKDGLYRSVTLEKVKRYLSILIVDIDYSDLFKNYEKSEKPYSKLVATIEFFKEHNSQTAVYEFLDNGFLDKIGTYNGDWRTSGFRFNDKQLFMFKGNDIGYDVFDQNNKNHYVNLAYKLATHLEDHLKIKKYHLEPSDKKIDLLREYLGYLKPITDPKTLEAYKKFKNH